jgi:hypothetical protein
MKTAGVSPFLIAGLMDGMSKEAVDTATGYTVNPAGQVTGGGNFWDNLKAESGGWWDRTRHFFGNNDPGLIGKVVNNEGAKTSPIASNIAKTIFKDPNQQASFLVHMGNGNFMDAASMAANHIGSSDMVKKWGPTVVPALASVGLGRLSGMGWGGSLALGAGAGLLGHQANAAGGYKNLSNDLLGTSFPESTRPPVVPTEAARVAPTVAPGAPAAGATPNAGVAETPSTDKAPVVPTGAAAAAEKTKTDNAANAAKIRIPSAVGE